MKKLFISCPMKGRTEENIRKSIEGMHKIAEIAFGEELEIVPSYHPEYHPDCVNKPVAFLGKAIEDLATADYFIGIGHSDFWKGCAIETAVARKYNIPSLFLDVYSTYCFFKDAEEIERKAYIKDVGLKDVCANG